MAKWLRHSFLIRKTEGSNPSTPGFFVLIIYKYKQQISLSVNLLLFLKLVQICSFPLCKNIPRKTPTLQRSFIDENFLKEVGFEPT